LRKDKRARPANARAATYCASNITADELPKHSGSLHPTDRSGSRFQKPQGRFEPAPIYHQLEHRIEAHISSRSGLLPARHAAPTIARLGPGLTPRSVLEKFATFRCRCASAHDRWTHSHPEPLHPAETDVQLLWQRLKLDLPAQPPPKSPPKAARRKWFCSEDLANRGVDFKHLRLSTPSNPPSRVRPKVSTHQKAAIFGHGLLDCCCEQFAPSRGDRPAWRLAPVFGCGE